MDKLKTEYRRFHDELTKNYKDNLNKDEKENFLFDDVDYGILDEENFNRLHAENEELEQIEKNAARLLNSGYSTIEDLEEGLDEKMNRDRTQVAVIQSTIFSRTKQWVKDLFI